MTHDGPYDSATTSHWGEPGMLKFGSPGLAKLVKEQKERILMNLHGHCHAGNTFDYQAGAPVINPGSLKEGNFMVLELCRKDERWHIDSVTKKFGPQL